MSQKTATMRLTLFILCTAAVFPSIFARNGSPANCCFKNSHKRVRLTSIASYWRQDRGLCPITAIVFTIEKGKVLCSDPASPWTIKAMRKVDEEAEQKRKHRVGQGPDTPQEGTEGLLATTMLPLTSRWPQVPARVAKAIGNHRAHSESKPQRGTGRRIRIIKIKKKATNKGGKRKRKNTKQPAFNQSSPFTTSSYK